MDLDLMRLSLCGHKRRLLRRKKKGTTVCVANCVAAVLVIYLSVVHWNTNLEAV